VRPPRGRILVLAEQIGEPAVARWCAGLLAGSIAYDDPDQPHITWLGGRHAAGLLRRHGFESGQDHWTRVWAARGLMYVWRADAESSVVKGLADHAWRVREMSAKVVRRRQVADAETILATLTADPAPRVRAAAIRALARVGEAEHAALVARCGDDPDAAVRRACRTALQELERRLDVRVSALLDPKPP
jgi:HEAT repeat protein